MIVVYTYVKCAQLSKKKLYLTITNKNVLKNFIFKHLQLIMYAFSLVVKVSIPFDAYSLLLIISKTMCDNKNE